MKKTTKERIKRYQESLDEAIRLGTKYNTALKALKDLPIENGFNGIPLQDAIKYVSKKLDTYSRTVRNSTHNIAIAEMRDK